MDDFGALQADFLDETQPLVEAVGQTFLGLERAWRRGACDPEGVAHARGLLHTVKGNAAMMGFEAVQLLAHVLEDLSAAGDTTPRAELGELVIEGGDLLARLLDACQEGTPDPALAEAFAARVHAHLSGAAPAAASAAPAMAGVQGTRVSDSIRVSFRRLDEMMALVGEAMIMQAGLGDAGVALGKTLRALHATLMESRLVALRELFTRFERYARDLGREHQRSLRLVTSGADTPIDKTLIERLGEPLLHLVRNAVAHGIEPVATRLALGKPAEATITLAAVCRADRVTLSVTDDGRGLDVDAIADKARALGHDVAGLDEDERRRLVFLPGVSTAKQVSTLAGRGIGLDVVAATVAALGGRLDVATMPGRGTTFSIDLPLTLAVVKGLLVEIGGEVVVLPMAYVQESLRLADAGGRALHELDGAWVMRLREKLVHVIDGGTALGLPGAAVRRPYCVVLAAGARRRGLLVDRVIGHQDVVVKMLDEELGKVDAVSGATILGDGRVVLILDGARIVEQRGTASFSPVPRVEASA